MKIKWSYLRINASLNASFKKVTDELKIIEQKQLAFAVILQNGKKIFHENLNSSTHGP